MQPSLLGSSPLFYEGRLTHNMDELLHQVKFKVRCVCQVQGRKNKLTYLHPLCYNAHVSGCYAIHMIRGLRRSRKEAQLYGKQFLGIPCKYFLATLLHY